MERRSGKGIAEGPEKEEETSLERYLRRQRESFEEEADTREVTTEYCSWANIGWGGIINVLVKNNLIYIYNKFSLSACNVPGHMALDLMELMV